MLIYCDYEIANLKDNDKIKKIQWARTILDAKIHPYQINTSILKNYTGKFGMKPSVIMPVFYTCRGKRANLPA